MLGHRVVLQPHRGRMRRVKKKNGERELHSTKNRMNEAEQIVNDCGAIAVQLKQQQKNWFFLAVYT